MPLPPYWWGGPLAARLCTLSYLMDNKSVLNFPCCTDAPCGAVGSGWELNCCLVVAHKHCMHYQGRNRAGKRTRKILWLLSIHRYKMDSQEIKCGGACPVQKKHLEKIFKPGFLGSSPRDFFSNVVFKNSEIQVWGPQNWQPSINERLSLCSSSVNITMTFSLNHKNIPKPWPLACRLYNLYSGSVFKLFHQLDFILMTV